MLMDQRPSDLDDARAAIVAQNLFGAASGYLTADIAVFLPFESLTPFKNLLKQFFSTSDWSAADEEALDETVAASAARGWWEHDLGGGIVLGHGFREGRYHLWVSGASGSRHSIFDRIFAGPVVPEATPHPRKVKFAFGGTSSPGVWHRRGDAEPPEDVRAKRLLDELDVTDVMVAGDFVTIGLAGRASWEERLDPLLALVTELFADVEADLKSPDRTRDELIQEAGRLHLADADAELHLLDPNDREHRERLTSALDHPDARTRRVAVALLAEATEQLTSHSAIERGYADDSRIVRRTAVDAAADTADVSLRSFFEEALDDGDAWIRWRAVRAIRDIGLDGSRGRIELLVDDTEFRVRFEAESVLRQPGGSE